MFSCKAKKSVKDLIYKELNNITDEKALELIYELTKQLQETRET